MYAIQDIKNPRFFTKAYQERAELVRTPNKLWDFYCGTPEQQPNGVVEMVYYPAAKQVAPGNTYGSQAKTLTKIGASEKLFKPIHMFNSISVDVSSLVAIRNDSDNTLDVKGSNEVNRQFDYLSYRKWQFKAAVLSKLLAAGICYFDSDYMVLEDSSGADTSKTIDWGVASTHKTTLNGIIGTDYWDVAATKILTQLDNLRIQAESENAEPPRHIWQNSTAKAYLRENTELKSFMVLNSSRAEAVLNGVGDEMELGGYVWHFTDQTYIGADGSTSRPFVPNNKAIITPDPGAWFKYIETSELVPTEVGVEDSVQTALGSFMEMYGDYTYCAVEHNPPRLDIFDGTNFFVGLANLNSIWIPTVGT